MRESYPDYHADLTRELARFDVAYFLVSAYDLDPDNAQIPDPPVTAYAVDVSRWRPVGRCEGLGSRLPDAGKVWVFETKIVMPEDPGLQFDSQFELRAGRLVRRLEDYVLERERRQRSHWLSAEREEDG